MARKFIGRIFLLTLVTAAVAVVSTLLVQKAISAQGRVAFTVISRDAIYDRSGKAVKIDQSLFAVRSDGSMARVRYVTPPGGRGVAVQKQFFDLRQAEEVYSDELTQSVSTFPLRKGAVEYYGRLPKCSGGDSAERGNMLGYEVVRVVHEPVGPGDIMIVRWDDWVSPALDCYPLKRTVYRGKMESDLYVSNVSEVVKITIGEPASWLFERPAGYAERSPSQRKEEFSRRYSETVTQSCPSCLQETYQEADELYQRRQADRGR